MLSVSFNTCHSFEGENLSQNYMYLVFLLDIEFLTLPLSAIRILLNYNTSVGFTCLLDESCTFWILGQFHSQPIIIVLDIQSCS
jgi:hypothetical protein